MTAKMFACALAFVTANALALPVPLTFNSTSRINSDAVIAGAASAFKTDQSPPSASPVITDATVFSNVDFASADSINAPGLLSTSAEADSDTGFASADATAEFIGTFLGRNVMELQLGFLIPASLSTGNGFAGANLFVTVMTGATTLYSNVFTTPGTLDLFINVPYGVTATLDILLESAADVLTGGSAFNAASVTFAASVPEPSTWLLLGLGFVVAVGAGRIRKQPALTA